MKTYNVRLFPCVFEHPGIPDEFYEAYEESSLSYLPSSVLDELGINVVDLNISSDNIEEALCKIYSYIRAYGSLRFPPSSHIISYSVTFKYFYGKSYRMKTFYIWTSRKDKMRFLERNRSYLTRDQIIHICCNPRLSFERYINYESDDSNGNYSVDTPRS